ncbi:LysR family transcriptional regulator [Acetobacter papayae]|uniref:LysR family transcriptional regulator n=1 Tax=Acetobacter papayae TaxID=1076592 RepID=UPI001F3144BF|nr:LysR family transcriptional regulator [Acetobacter papayae]
MALDDLTDIAFFVSLVDAGSITAASRRLSVSSAAVSRRLAKLEERLGIGLIIRNTRHFHLSDSGQIYYDGGLKIVEENERLESEVIQSDQSLKGSLSIGAPLELGRHKLAPFIASFSKTPATTTQLGRSV